MENHTRRTLKASYGGCFAIVVQMIVVVLWYISLFESLNEIVPRMTFNMTRSLDIEDESFFGFDQKWVRLPQVFTESISDWTIQPYVEIRV